MKYFVILPHLITNCYHSLNYRNYIPLNPPTFNRYDNIGATGNTSYNYKLSAVSDDGETDLSDEITTYNSNAVLSSVNFIRIFWNQSDSVNYYKLYIIIFSVNNI